MSVHDIYQYWLARELSTSIKKNNPLLTEIADLHNNEPSYKTRKAEKWKVPKSRTSYGMPMFENNLPRWLNRFDSQGIEAN